MEVTDESLDPYFTRLGKFSHYWASMETALTAAVSVIYHRYGGSEIIKDDLPRTRYNKKAQYFRDAVADIPALHRLAPQVQALLKKTDALAQDRHLFTHGTPRDFSTPQLVVVWWLDVQKDFSLQDKGRIVSWDELEAMGNEASVLADEMLDIANGLIQTLKDQVS